MTFLLISPLSVTGKTQWRWDLHKYRDGYQGRDKDDTKHKDTAAVAAVLLIKGAGRSSELHSWEQPAQLKPMCLARVPCMGCAIAGKSPVASSMPEDAVPSGPEPTGTLPAAPRLLSWLPVPVRFHPSCPCPQSRGASPSPCALRSCALPLPAAGAQGRPGEPALPREEGGRPVRVCAGERDPTAVCQRGGTGTRGSWDCTVHPRVTCIHHTLLMSPNSAAFKATDNQ